MGRYVGLTVLGRGRPRAHGPDQGLLSGAFGVGPAGPTGPVAPVGPPGPAGPVLSRSVATKSVTIKIHGKKYKRAKLTKLSVSGLFEGIARENDP